MRDTTFWIPMLALMLVTLIGCEFWAAFVHRVVWHGFLWPLHKSHHAGPLDVAPNAEQSRLWEYNDLFGVFHGIFATALIMFGLRADGGLSGALCTGVGAGLTVYGLAYGLVHDGIIHGRLMHLQLSRGYLRRVQGAHLSHHRTGKAPYGLFLGPLALRRHGRRTKR